ncbi:MAG TPA: branched-chain amino acid ABC transporter permease [Fimbriimonadaceae bacterium]|nr:branched-chain amino acid ABC transporter permease [Fimbriimonadaceae bacterium]
MSASNAKDGQGRNPAGRAVLGVLVVLLLAFLIGVFLFKADAKSFPQQLVGGILLGSIYALIALGYTMVYGVLRLINFAHGEVFMLGAYTSLLTSWVLGFGQGSQKEATSPITLAIMLLVSMAVCGIVGVLIERFAYRPMRNQPRIASLITAIGVSLLLQYGGALVLPVSPPPSVNEKVNPYREVLKIPVVPQDKALLEQFNSAEQEVKRIQTEMREAQDRKDPSADGFIRLKSEAETKLRDVQGKLDQTGLVLRIPVGQLIMFGTTIVLMLLLRHLVLFTKTGRAMRAVSHDFDSAGLMGINVGQIVTLTFLVGSALAGAGAMMNATFIGTALTTQFGVLPGVKAFVAAVLGGIGNIPGAVLGGLLMGVAENVVTWYGKGQYRDAIAFVILIVVLLFKPGGLLGSAKVEKV